MPDGTAAGSASSRSCSRTSTSSTRRRSSRRRRTPPTPRSTSEAERDPEGWWESWAREARLGRALEQGARLEPALGEVVRRRQAERLAQLPRPPRRRRASASASPTTGRARTASGATITYAELLEMTKRFANVLKEPRRRARRPRRDLPADGPRGARRDARLRAHRRAPLGRVRRLLRGGRQGPHQRLRGEGAGDGRLLAAARQAAPDEGGDRRGPAASAPRSSTCVVVRRTGGDVPWTEGRDVWWHEARRGRLARLPGRAVRRRADAVPALHVRHHGEAEGHRAHERRLPDRRDGHAQPGVRHQARDATSTGARPTSAGSPATATSSTGRSRTAARRSCTRARRTTPTRTAGGTSSSATSARSSTPRRRRSARASSGAASTRTARPLVAAPARQRRRADQPARVALVPRGDRRRALPDRRHVVADRDRPHHDHAAAGDHAHEAGLGDGPVPGRSRPRSTTRRATRSRRAAASWS